MTRVFLILSLSLIWLTGPGGFDRAQAESHDGEPQAGGGVAAARLDYLAGNYDTVLSVLLPAAEAGDAVAQNVMANAYDDGLGVAQDFDKALHWWQAAADQGMAKAIYNLGVFHAQGRPGHPVDFGKAAGYYDRAIELGYHFAMNNRGSMYENGQGGPVDMDRARELYEQAAELGNLDAMNNLGLLYLNANGVDEDLGRAIGMFRMAAEAGSATGLSNLGASYANGYGVAQDELAAMGLYWMAAKTGHARGAINLAYALIEGEEAWRDPVRGYAWCQVAVARAKPAEAEGFREDCAYLGEQIGAEAMKAGEEMAADLP